MGLNLTQLVTVVEIVQQAVEGPLTSHECRGRTESSSRLSAGMTKAQGQIDGESGLGKAQGKRAQQAYGQCEDDQRH